MPPGFPPLVRPAGLARPATPAPVPEPQHHHLPAWVRRAHAQARPILADMLGTLTGEPRQQLETMIDDVVAAISAGKFSQAARYAAVIAEGEKLLTAQRAETEALARVQRALDGARRRVSAQLRDAAPLLGQDTASRLSKALRSAADQEAISAVEAELESALSAARAQGERRREREITRTRTRIERAVPRSGGGMSEDWQDVLRRLQEEMTAGSASG